jgi:alkanesulfonate monooxygenase SsuD/methylene tetrahydromethanopterin reductase-like flavin-dependent oxidoreductase (luciferase family)
MIGGGGERRTLRLAARYADWWCADVGPLETFVHKSAVLDEHCRELGRDPARLTRAQVAWVSLGPRRKQSWPDVHVVAGSPGDVAAELIAFRRAGVDHFPLRLVDFPSTDGLCRFAEEVMPRLTDAWE